MICDPCGNGADILRAYTGVGLRDHIPDDIAGIIEANHEQCRQRNHPDSLESGQLPDCSCQHRWRERLVVAGAKARA